MRTLKKLKGLAASLLIGLMMTGTASAAPVLCQVVTNYHMLVDSDNRFGLPGCGCGQPDG